MKLLTKKVLINPPFPIKQAGFIQQTQKCEEIHDPLFARVLGFMDQEKILILISADNLGFPLSVSQHLEKAFSETFSLPVFVTLSCTHTHFGPHPNDKSYQHFFIHSLLSQVCESDFKESGDCFFQFSSLPFSEVGTSRITNHQATIQLQLLSILDHKRKRLATLIIYNCHPTILHGDTSFFSAEYPGYVLAQLQQEFPEEFFTFFQGAAGDVSSRFTRKDQTYDSVKLLGDALVKKISDILKADSIQHPFSFHVSHKELPIQHTLEEVDLSSLPKNLSPRELETIEVGKKVRADLLTHGFTDLTETSILASHVSLGKINFLFFPFELFSDYLNYIDLNNTCLICYSQGYAGYVLDYKSELITYERFTDTLSSSSKLELINFIQHSTKNKL